MADVDGVVGDAADLVEEGQCRRLTGDVQRARILAQQFADRGVGLPQEVPGGLVAESARPVADPLLVLGVEVVQGPGEREAAGLLLGDPVAAAVPQRDAVGGDGEHPERTLGGLRRDQVAGEEGVREDHAFGHRAGQGPHLVLTRRGEDHQAVLGVRQVHLGERFLQMPDDIDPALPADRGIRLQLLLGVGHDIAQPDRVLGVLGLPAVRRGQDGHRGIRARAAQLGERGGTQCMLHDSTIGLFRRSGIGGESDGH